MGEISEAAIAGTMVLEELDGGGASGGGDEASAPEPGNLRCRSCALWPRPQTWLCVVPLLIGFIGLGLSLMLLKWIVVGSVQDYVPTDLVNSKGIEQDPIFLSKPSAVPKSPQATSPSGSFPTVRPHHRPGARPSAAPTLAPSSRTPHLHNRISTRLTTTTVRPPHPPGREVPPRSTTVRRNGPANGRNGPPSSTRVAPPSSSPSPSRHPVLRGTARTLNRERSSKGMPLPPTRPHPHTRTVAPTSPSLPSEHFKPCKDKDLTYCLNEGECFVIQTLTGLHKHCRCKEGFQGIRCDQFLPKTDSMLSYPAEHLGIEFMEGKDMYKREILTVSCITIGISLLGTICMALYCQNKRRREKLRAHLMVSCSLETPNMALDPVLTDESRSKIKSGPKVQEHNKDPGSSPPHGDAAHCSGFPQNCQATPSYPKAPPTKKKSRSRSLSCSPGQRIRVFHYQTAPRRSQPISRGRLNAIGALRDSGHSYQHLQEVEDSEKEVQSLRVWNCSDSGSPGFHNGNLNLPRGDGDADWRGDTGVHSNRLEHSTPLHQSLRTCSVPIIPSFQEQDFTSCVLEKTYRECEKSNPQGMFPHVAATKTGCSGLWGSQEEGSAEVFWTLPHASEKDQESYDKFLALAGGGASGEAQNKLDDRELRDMSGHADHSVDYSQPYLSKKNSDHTAHIEGTRQ